MDGTFRRIAGATVGTICLAACYSIVWLAAWVAVPSVGLGWTPQTITSGSMQPSLDVGDVVLTSDYDGETMLAPGTVVTYDDPTKDGIATTHRIHVVSDDGTYRTKGDANPHPDSTPLEPAGIRGVGRIVVPVVGTPLVWMQQGELVPLVLAAVGLLVLFSYASSIGWHEEDDEDDDHGGDDHDGPGSGSPQEPRVSRRGVRRPGGSVLVRISVVASIVTVLASGTVLVTGAAYSSAVFSAATTNDGNAVLSGFWALNVGGGDAHTCGRKADDTVWCWGRNDKGQLGDGTTTGSDTAVQVVGVGGSGTLDDVLQLEVGVKATHTCVTRDDETAACWGENGSGRLGDGTTTDRTHPVVFDDASGSPMTGILRVAPGKEHTCVARKDRTVWCVGRNDKGQLGDGTTTDAITPVQVVGVGGTGTLSGVVGLSSGEKHTCAVRDDGTVVCWGQGDKGQLGNAATGDSATPVEVRDGAGGTLSGAASIAAGKKFTCVVTAGAGLRCWGENNEGQLGDGTTVDASTPVQVSGLSGVEQVDGGETHTCARLDDGSAWCWGRNDKGQLGDGTTTDSETPVPVPGPTGLRDLGIGAGHSCAVEDGGAVWCWGVNADGQLGDATTSDSSSPVRVVEAVDSYVGVTGASQHTCAYDQDSAAWCWGRNDKGQLGDGTTTGSLKPVQVVGIGGTGTLTGVSQVDTGPESGHTCALLDDGTAACWGLNGSGQLGDGSTTDRTHPVSYDDASGLPMAGISQVAPGKEHTCVARTDGTVWCVGRNDKGQLGNGTTTDSTVPVPVLGVGGAGTLTGVTALASGEKHTCAVRGDATVVCWGQGDKGQLGNAATSDSSTPVIVQDGSGGSFTGAASVTAGKKHTCVVTTGTGVYCWGENNEGQTGDGTTTDRSTAVQTVESGGSAFTGVAQVDGAEQGTCARRTDGTVWCWGRNDKGQLGNGTTTDAETPVQVPGLASAVDLGTGKDHGCAVEADGAAWCWGVNVDGQLGDTTTNDATSPVAVMG